MYVSTYVLLAMCLCVCVFVCRFEVVLHDIDFMSPRYIISYNTTILLNITVF